MSRAKPASKARGSLSDLHLAQVKRLFAPLIAPDPDAWVRERLRHGYRLEGPAVVFFESRPRHDNHAEWLDHDVAKFRFTRASGEWTLCCQFRDLKWRAYEPFPHGEFDGWEAAVAQ